MMKARNKPTSMDIAHLAGVSQPTVSRALRNSPLVSPKTRRRVQRIAPAGRAERRPTPVEARFGARELQPTLQLILVACQKKNGILQTYEQGRKASTKIHGGKRSI